MQAYPHHYIVQALAAPSGHVSVSTEGVDALDTNAPPEFDGPGGTWSPESLLIAAVADCYALSFRSVARASKLEWLRLEVEVEGVLDRVDGVTRFTHFTLRPCLALSAAASETLARTVLEKAKRLCLVTNSLNAQFELDPVLLREEVPA